MATNVEIQYFNGEFYESLSPSLVQTGFYGGVNSGTNEANLVFAFTPKVILINGQKDVVCCIINNSSLGVNHITKYITYEVSGGAINTVIYSIMDQYKFDINTNTLNIKFNPNGSFKAVIGSGIYKTETVDYKTGIASFGYFVAIG